MASISPMISPNPPPPVHRPACLRLCFCCLAAVSSLLGPAPVKLSYPLQAAASARPTPLVSSTYPFSSLSSSLTLSPQNPTLWPQKTTQPFFGLISPPSNLTRLNILNIFSVHSFVVVWVWSLSRTHALWNRNTDCTLNSHFRMKLKAMLVE